MALTIYFCLFIFIITFKIGLGFIVYDERWCCEKKYKTLNAIGHGQ